MRGLSVPTLLLYPLPHLLVFGVHLETLIHGTPVGKRAVTSGVPVNGVRLTNSHWLSGRLL